MILTTKLLFHLTFQFMYLEGVSSVRQKLNFVYRPSRLSCPRARQLHRIESLHPPDHLMTFFALRATIKAHSVLRSLVQVSKL